MKLPLKDYHFPTSESISRGEANITVVVQVPLDAVAHLTAALAGLI